MRSALTHEFRRGKVEHDVSCLYSSFRYVNGTWDTIDNKRVRSLVVDRILINNNLYTAASERCNRYTTVEDYCEQIKKGKLRGGKPEVRALSMIARIIIRQVSIAKNNQGNIHVTISNYGEEAKSFSECVYILYDEETKHYDPMYVVNKVNLAETTIFKRDDATVLELLRKFIREELHDVGFMQSDSSIASHEIELATGTDLIDETDERFSMILSTASTNLSNKRKILNHDNLMLSRTTGKELSSTKIAKLDVHTTSELGFSKFHRNTTIIDESSSESMDIEPFLQTDMLDSDAVPAVEQRPTTDISVTSTQEHQTTKMRFEDEPAEGFRGRTKGNFKPKKRNGQPSGPRPPRYFPDRNGRHYLNLLIREAYFSADHRLEICIVTREINGYTYTHPYFKFQVHPTDPRSVNLNPIYKYFDGTTESTAYSELLRQLKLQLVVVMHTNKELMACEQPLKVFSSSENHNNAPAITRRFNKHRAFKEAYDLHGLRFAITLCKRQPDQQEYDRQDDIQYISQISREDRKYKKNQIASP